MKQTPIDIFSAKLSCEERCVLFHARAHLSKYGKAVQIHVLVEDYLDAFCADAIDTAIQELSRKGLIDLIEDPVFGEHLVLVDYPLLPRGSGLLPAVRKVDSYKTVATQLEKAFREVEGVPMEYNRADRALLFRASRRYKLEFMFKQIKPFFATGKHKKGIGTVVSLFCNHLARVKKSSPPITPSPKRVSI